MNRPTLSDQIASEFLKALDFDGRGQAELARDMGITPKHMNAMVHGKSGALGIYDFAAWCLHKRWVVTLVDMEEP